jgi:hypothetical protein
MFPIPANARRNVRYRQRHRLTGRRLRRYPVPQRGLMSPRRRAPGLMAVPTRIDLERAAYARNGPSLGSGYPFWVGDGAEYCA